MTARIAASPVGPGDRVIDVLARDERLVDIFVLHAPQFEKLRSPAFRRVMARLVTVEQAARMAGVAAETLVHDLNVALLGAGVVGAAVPSPRAEASTVPPAATRPAALSFVELDVREDMRVGREPFSRIIAAVSTLDDGQGLRLRTIFEPVPLFALLARRGFSYDSQQEAPDDWSAWFWRASGEPEPRVDAHIPPVATLGRNDEGFEAAQDERREREVWLDVRGLEPPQPMLRTLAALEALPEGHELVQINSRVPQLLLPMLAERGYACELDESQTDRVLVRIWRPDHR